MEQAVPAHDVINPATEELVQTVALADVEETDKAIDRATTAQKTWRGLAPADRARLLRRGGGRRPGEPRPA
jgi:acyl-CoA reductase-like NAD-dependent aldehyde dehydrogenase